MKLSQWAKKVGISYKTAWRWFKDGNLPVEAEQMASGTIIIKDEESKGDSKEVAIYARVSSCDQKADLERQVARLLAFANENGWAVKWSVTEVGSGLNGSRPKLLKLLKEEKVKIIVVEHRDRLMRFGSEYVEATLAGEGRKLVIVDNTEVEDDLVDDMISVLTYFCARLYGRRSAKNKARRAVEAILQEKK
jgi:predicted site-specific integrase-resolvase